jgi:hypothetical protein
MMISQKVCNIDSPLFYLVLAGTNFSLLNSPKNFARPEGQDLVAVEEKLCSREGRAIPGFAYRFADPKPDGTGRGRQFGFLALGE